MRLVKASQSVRIIQLIILFLKLPFLFIGYGPEEDAWGHVLNIIEMYDQGHYIISRLPGHPAYEAIMFFFFPLLKYPYIINGLSALAGAFAIFEFYRLALALRAEYPVFWTLGFALLPAFFFGSTYAIDYAFTIWTMLRAVRLLFQGKYFYSGIFIGLSTAFRITSLVLLLPAFIYMVQNKVKAWKILYPLSAAMVVSFIFYLPAILTYGFDFFDYHRPPGSGFLKAFYKFLPGSLGVLGSLGILFILMAVFLKNKNVIAEQLKKPTSVFCFVTASLFLISYIKLPEKSAFTIPFYAFLFLLLTLFRFRQIRFVIALLCLSIFISGIQVLHPHRGVEPSKYSLQLTVGGVDVEFSPFKGLYFSELEKRKNKEKFADCAFKELSKFKNSKMAVITGWWYAQLRSKEWIQNTTLPVYIVYYVTNEELNELLDRGYTLYHLEDLNEINDRLRNTNLKNLSQPIEIKCL